MSPTVDKKVSRARTQTLVSMGPLSVFCSVSVRAFVQELEVKFSIVHPLPAERRLGSGPTRSALHACVQQPPHPVSLEPSHKFFPTFGTFLNVVVGWDLVLEPARASPTPSRRNSSSSWRAELISLDRWQASSTCQMRGQVACHWNKGHQVGCPDPLDRVHFGRIDCCAKVAMDHRAVMRKRRPYQGRQARYCTPIQILLWNGASDRPFVFFAGFELSFLGQAFERRFELCPVRKGCLRTLAKASDGDAPHAC